MVGAGATTTTTNNNSNNPKPPPPSFSSSNPNKQPPPSQRKSRWEKPNPNPNPNTNTKPEKLSSSTHPPNPPPNIKKNSLLGPPPPHPEILLAPVPPHPVNSAPFIPPYNFHMLERRTIMLFDSTVRSYFSLPLDYPDVGPPLRPHPIDLQLERESDRFLPFTHGHGPGHEGGGPSSGPRERRPMPFEREGSFERGGGQNEYWREGGGSQSQKRKFSGEEERNVREGSIRDKFAWHRQQLLQYGNPETSVGNNGDGFLGGAGMSEGNFRRGGGEEDMRLSKQMRGGGGGEYEMGYGRGEVNVGRRDDVDPKALKRAFLRYVKMLFENKEKYLEDKKQKPLDCVACGRDSKEFPDMHILVMHAFNWPESRVEHLALHKALCVLMGWSYAKVPDHSMGYRSLCADEEAANQEDLILWPPVVIIHNTSVGRDKDGRMESMGNKVMDNMLKDLGFSGGKSKAVYGKEGHQGTMLVKFAGNKLGLTDALRLAEHFEKESHGRKGWSHAQSTQSGRGEENNPCLIKNDEKTGEKKKIHYGYLGTAWDLDKVDYDTRKRCDIESRREVK